MQSYKALLAISFNLCGSSDSFGILILAQDQITRAKSFKFIYSASLVLLLMCWVIKSMQLFMIWSSGSLNFTVQYKMWLSWWMSYLYIVWARFVRRTCILLSVNLGSSLDRNLNLLVHAYSEPPNYESIGIALATLLNTSYKVSLSKENWCEW